jgi:uncharacterized protein (DUF4415 family)
LGQVWSLGSDFRTTQSVVEIHPSARRHGVDDEDIRHAIDHSLATEDAGEDPDRWLVIGPDRAGNLLEVVVLFTIEGAQGGDPRNEDARQVQEADRAVSKDRVYGHTRSGEPITNKDIETLAAEAEAGYDVDALLARRGKRGRPALGSAPASVESVRLDPELRDQLLERAKAEGTTTSEVIREALRRFLKAA